MRNGTVAPTLLSRYSNDDRSSGRGAPYHDHDPSEDPTTRRPALKRPPPAPVSFAEPPSSVPTRSLAPGMAVQRPMPRAPLPMPTHLPVAAVGPYVPHAQIATPMPFAPVADGVKVAAPGATYAVDASSSLVRSISKVEQHVWRRVSSTLGNYFPAMKTSRLAREVVLFTLVVIALLPVAGLVLAHIA